METGAFTNQLWESIQDIYAKLVAHPFINQLALGMLAYNCFAHYLSQDVLYIKDDAVALHNLTKKTTSDDEKQFFEDMSNDGIAIEQELHRFFLNHFKVNKAKEKSPVVAAYTRFLINHSENSSYGIAAAALLPCYWIYYEIGQYIIANAVENNPYQKWIDTYRGDEYVIYTEKFIQIVENLSKNANNSEKQQMQEAFISATNFELNFFDEAMQQQHT